MKLWDLLTEERALAMAWHLDREGRSSYLVGSAHFFPYKFRRALRSLARGASCVIVEGPLESGELREVARRGMGGQEGEGLSRFLDELTLAKLARVVGNQRDGSKGLLPWDALSGLGTDKGLRLVLDGMQPWMAFFTLWVTHLETLGWIYHMDRDALTIGKKMGCRVVQLESMEEQLTALEQIPKERILSFLKEADQWKHYSRLYVKLYLRGDLEGLLGLSKGFPSRCEAVIDNRDRVLYQRMLPYLERGGAVVLVGAPHTRAMLGWLRKEGYEVRQVLIR